jgi:sugar lactone lactonase YvrE
MGGRTIRLIASLGVAAALGPRLAAASPSVQASTEAAGPASLRLERVLDRATLASFGVTHPSRLAYDAEDCLYVLDVVSRHVVKLDPSGRLLHDVGGYGEDEASFSIPCDLAVDRRQSLLVLDRGRGALLAFDRSGAFLATKSFGSDVSREAFSPNARLLVDPMGDLWLLSETERDLIQLDDLLQRGRASRFLAPEDSLTAPSAATFLPRGGIWVYDIAPGALLRFTSSGRLLRAVASPDPAFAGSPVALASDASGSVYAADPRAERLLVYGEDGTLLVDRPLGGATQPWRPTAVAVSPGDRVAIADPDRGEIQILAITRGTPP